jgi:hypothetical protein
VRFTYQNASSFTAAWKAKVPHCMNIARLISCGVVAS